MKTCAFHSLGCKVNSYETEVMQQQMTEAGYTTVAFSETADIYIINTCTVTNIADRKSRQMLHRARKLNPDAVVVGVGCYVQAAGKVLIEDGTVDILVGNNQKGCLVDLIGEYMDSRENGQLKKENQSALCDIACENDYEAMQLSRPGEHTRAFIKIQDGCNQFCSYCLIPYVRGRVRSRSLSDIYKEVAALAENGYKEVVLTGIHLSSYGTDIKTGVGLDLLTVIQKLAEIEKLQRIRLGSLEQGIITREFAKSLAGLEKLCPHFHLSLQSGCDETLARMNRRYRTQEFKEKCAVLREYFEHPAITTDVIVGFPGETEEEFNRTKQFVSDIHFYEMHVFQYSKRQGTKAADMPGQVADQIKHSRSQKLIELAKSMSDDFRNFYVGKEIEVLVEEPLKNHDGYMCGYTKEYVRAAFPADLTAAGSLKTIKVEALHDNLLWGRA